MVNGDIQVDGNLYLADADATPTIGANADLTLNGIGYSDAGTVVIDGDLVNTGYMSFGNTAGDASLVTGTGSFDNSGLLDFFDLQTNNTVNVNFDNSGTVKVELEGTLNLSNGTNSGTLSLDDGAVLNFGSGFTLTDDSVIGYHGEGNSYGTITFDDVLTLSGTTTVDGNIDLILDGTVSAPLTGSGELDTAGDVVFNSGTITDPSIVTRGETALVTAEERDIETLWTNHGTFYMSDGTLEIDNTGTLQNHGTLELSGGVLDINAGDNALINAADGYMLITGTNSLSTSASTGGNIDNAGVILYERDELFSFSSALTNSGTIDIDQGTLLLATSGGDFGGDYEIDVFGNLKFTNTSTLSDAGVTGGGNILVHSTRLAVSNSTATTFAASLIFMDSSTLALSNEALTIDALNNEGAATLAYDASDSLVVTGESTLSDVIIDGVGSGQVVNQGLMTFSNLFGTSTFLTGDALMNDTDGWITIGDGLGNTQVTDEGMGNFVNKGLFVLDELHSDGVSGGDASFVKTEGTLENAGTISFSDQLGGATGARTIEALINNTGLIELWGVDATLNFNTAVAASHINAGTIDLGTTGQVFDLNGTGALDLVNSGVIAGAGTISLNDVGFDNSQGTLEVGGDGSHGVLEISSNGTLDFSGLIEMEICGTEAGASHDQLVLSGQSVINAAEFSIDMSDGSGYQDGAVYDIALINASSAAYGDVDFTDEDLYSGTLGSLDATIAEITVNGGTLSLTGVDVTDIASSASASTGADYYLGSNSAESFGTDMGTLGSGSDVFLGFGGDDTLAITSDGATLPFSYVDGGSGLDRLSLYAANEAGETVSFLDDIWRTNSFEVIDLADADGQTLKLDKDAIEAFDNDVDQLINMNGTLSLTGIESYVVVDGDANDTLDLSADGGTWTMSGTAELDSSGSGGTKEGYTMYANGDARVFVDQDVNVT
ncbi:MAG: beta strand repeat-containing protein [Rhodospirillaceae bacterium]